ncbi:hypothetical protein BYI23_E000430 (plasmid) [Burkholderia sp. YI23]|uniref:Uncharacterized protein n=1 Tax=Burkholderia vietnamiensis (strain G4 / LMG 22486) TaxID=269482 RepID=A4JTV8_BURVG|nr:hypothetical protein Bcep1808_6824 [Burkholderia vietnamiensis G4]AET95204.1 hypothetical protein BYI23_E000430 [Burkholderia sp. YI23]MCB4350130.1 hypothetical protein [Burkholderia vietnamiensis]
MQLEILQQLMSDLDLTPTTLQPRDMVPLFPDVASFDVTVEVTNKNFVVGDLMKSERVSSASHLLEVPNEITNRATPAASAAWKVRLKTGVTLIMVGRVEPAGSMFSSLHIAMEVHVVEDELFVPFVEDFAVERCRRSALGSLQTQMEHYCKSVAALLDGTKGERASFIVREIEKSFSKELSATLVDL